MRCFSQVIIQTVHIVLLFCLFYTGIWHIFCVTLYFHILFSFMNSHSSHFEMCHVLHISYVFMYSSLKHVSMLYFKSLWIFFTLLISWTFSSSCVSRYVLLLLSYIFILIFTPFPQIFFTPYTVFSSLLWFADPSFLNSSLPFHLSVPQKIIK